MLETLLQGNKSHRLLNNYPSTNTCKDVIIINSQFITVNKDNRVLQVLGANFNRG